MPPTLRTVNLKEKFAQIPDHWNPRVVGELAGQQVKLAKFKGAFDWHFHAQEDELFLVVQGTLRMGLRDPEERDVLIQEGEFLIVPRGVYHRPESLTEEAWVMMFEPASTLNTGNLQNERTRTDLEHL